jgi:MarR family transcriptional regulator, temperature-dependent positive regulator of motility
VTRPKAIPETGASSEQSQPLEIHAMPGHLIRRLQQASAAIFDNEVKRTGFDLTSVQFASLTMIAAHPGLDQASLAQGIAYDRVTIGGVVDRLEQKGLIRREVAENDRRARRLFLRPAGEDALARIRPAVHAVQKSIVQGLSKAEAAEFSRLMRKALDAVGDINRMPARTQKDD